MAPQTDGGSDGSTGTPNHPVITAVPNHEIKLEPEQIKRLAEILVEKVCEPLERAAKAIEEAEEKAGFTNFGLKFGSTEIAHIICVQVSHQNVKSFSDKTVKEDIGKSLHITAQTWREAESHSKTTAE
ncbi:MAG: hypothetical protein ACRDP6_37085 [Actinoallomurus sp.]